MIFCVTDFAVGGACGVNRQGRHEVDLSGTPFSFAPDIHFVYAGWDTWTVETKFNSTYSYLSGGGFCGSGMASSNMHPDEEFYPFVPLTLTQIGN